MSAGLADFTIEQGADFAVQIFWVNDQTGSAIQAQGPMDMDIVSPRTGQRLIRLDDGANGGIDNGGGPWGIVQLQISRDATIAFASGPYVYDLYVFSVGPPLQRVRLLRGNVTVAPMVTDLGVAAGQLVNPGIMPPDIILDASAGPLLSFDSAEPTNLYKSPESGVPLRAGLRGPGNFAASPVQYAGSKGNGPVRDAHGAPINGSTLNAWMAVGAVLTVTFSKQTGGLIVSKVESAPGGAPSPPARTAALAGAAEGGSNG